MPSRKSGITELKKNRKRRLHNLDIKTDLRKTIKTFHAAIDAKKKDEAQSNLKLVYKKLDKATKRNIINKNTASRRKSRFSRQLASLTS